MYFGFSFSLIDWWNYTSSSLLVLAATDTTSSALTGTLDILGHRLDIQEKLRAEIDEAQEKCGNNIPYDTLVALPYLDAICREILRL